MVLVRSESGQLLMIPQQALAQMQAQAQGGMAPRTATPTNVPSGQVRSQSAQATIVSQCFSSCSACLPAYSSGKCSLSGILNKLYCSSCVAIWKLVFLPVNVFYYYFSFMQNSKGQIGIYLFISKCLLGFDETV